MRLTTKNTLGEVAVGSKHDDSWHKLLCCACGLRHLMADRVRQKDEDGFTTFFCPQCKEESYYNITIHGGPK